MVPVLATGWGDVQKRVQAMNQTASVHQQRVKELNQALANLNAGRLQEASKKFSAIDRQHPYSEFARKSMVMGAFTNYRLGN